MFFSLGFSSIKNRIQVCVEKREKPVQRGFYSNYQIHKNLKQNSILLKIILKILECNNDKFGDISMKSISFQFQVNFG